MISISINNEIIKIAKKYGILSDYLGSALFVLNSLASNNYTLLDEFDNENKDGVALNVYKDLEIKDLIKKTVDSKDTLYELTTTGLVLINELAELNINSSKSSKKIKTFNLDFVEEWVNLWRNPITKIYYKDGTRSLGISSKDAKTRFIGFLSDYKEISDRPDYDKIILQATKNYIEEQKKVNFSFSKGAKNFISLVEKNTKDSKTSLLAFYCEEYINSLDGLSTNSEKPTSYDTSIN